jgi:hypothetical protein
MVDRKMGYLACIDNVPPLIFRFQFNPDILSEKKSYKYREANSFGSWNFDQTSAASGVIGRLTGLYKDVKEIGALLVATKPLEAEEGDQRSFSIDFALDATVPGALDDGDHYGGSIEPDLAVLRSFMNPSWDLIDVTKMVASSFKDVPCWNKPPECSLYYGGLSVTCVMTDLNIKVMSFFDDGKPSRAEVSVTLKEQTFSISPLSEFFTRHRDVFRSYDRHGFGSDVLAVTPIVNLFVP